MRVSSLSSERIQRLVSRYFVPVWVSRDGYQLDKPAREDRELLARIDASRREQKLEGGAVCVYVATAEGKVLATLPVQKAHKPELLAPFLEKVVAGEKIAPRSDEAAAARVGRERPRARRPGARTFTVYTRFEDRGTNRGTSRDTAELNEKKWQGFLPPPGVKAGRSWKVPAASAREVLRFAYPPLPHWKAGDARMVECRLEARADAVSEKEVRFSLRGRCELVYPDRGKPDDGRVTARVVGTGSATPDGKLLGLRLTSEDGRYVWHWQGKPQVKPMAFAAELDP